MQKPETALSNAIQKYIETDLRGKVMKLHGSPMQSRGEPDLIGGFIRDGQVIHFAVELKMPGEQPTPIQKFRLAQWDFVGFRTGVVYSLLDFKRIVGALGWEVTPCTEPDN